VSGSVQARPTAAAASQADYWAAEIVGSDGALRQVLHGLPGTDTVGVQQRAAALATRSIKREAKLWALDAAIRMTDLTTLEGADTPGKVRGLCAKARRPDPQDAGVPPVAAVCVYPDLVAVARGEVAGSGVKVASVATAFPSGRASLAVKLADGARSWPVGTARSARRSGRSARPAGRCT
jgi:deoxyribose-phosphate aldolase